MVKKLNKQKIEPDVHIIKVRIILRSKGKNQSEGDKTLVILNLENLILFCSLWVRGMDSESTGIKL